MNPRPFSCAAGFALLAILSILQGSASADVLPPEPRTTWGRGKTPNETGVVIAGIALSAAVVVSGLLLARMTFSQSRWAKVLLLGLVATVDIGVILGACRYVLLVREDRAKWAQWEVQRSSRRYGGRPPDLRPPEPLPPEPGPSAEPPTNDQK